MSSPAVKNCFLSVIVPVYCGEATVEPLTAALKQALDGRYRWELIYVWDCGPDNSLARLEALRRANPELITLMVMQKNCGQHAATALALGQAAGVWCVTMDEDLQHNPEDIHRLLAVQQATGADVVYGNYDSHKKHGLRRSLAALLVKTLIGLAVPGVPHYVSAFRLLRGDAARQLHAVPNSGFFLDGALSRQKHRTACCPVEHHARLAGASGYNYRKLINYALMIFIKFSLYPQIALIAGLAILLSGFMVECRLAVLGGTVLGLSGLLALAIARCHALPCDRYCPVAEIRRR